MLPAAILYLNSDLPKYIRYYLKPFRIENFYDPHFSQRSTLIAEFDVPVSEISTNLSLEIVAINLFGIVRDLVLYHNGAWHPCLAPSNPIWSTSYSHVHF